MSWQWKASFLGFTFICNVPHQASVLMAISPLSELTQEAGSAALSAALAESHWVLGPGTEKSNLMITWCCHFQALETRTDTGRGPRGSGNLRSHSTLASEPGVDSDRSLGWQLSEGRSYVSGQRCTLGKQVAMDGRMVKVSSLCSTRDSQSGVRSLGF
jgi:hypothetical protein